MYDIYMYLKASMPGMKNGLLEKYQKTTNSLYAAKCRNEFICCQLECPSRDVMILGQHHARAGGGIPGDESHMIEVVSPRAQ